MFSDLDTVDKSIIYKALVMMIEANSGIGFHNHDQGHPAYRLGADGKEGMGDGAEQNALFKMVAALSTELAENSDMKPSLSTWQKFCTFATEAYDRKHQDDQSN